LKGWLLDTNVISAAAPARAGHAAALVAWLEQRSDDLYLSAVTIAEIESGIARLRRRGGTHGTDDLASWLEALLHLYGDHVLAFDLAAARVAGALADLAIKPVPGAACAQRRRRVAGCRASPRE